VTPQRRAASACVHSICSRTAVIFRIISALVRKLAASSGVAYRITTGLTDRKSELRLESKGRAVLLHSTNGDWFDTSCAAISVSGINHQKISYIVVPWGRQPAVGAYDLSTEKPLSETEVDSDALRREMYRVYHRQRNFPRSADAELLQWAQLSDGCQIAFHELYGSADM
jgi:hypothetical protein